MTEPLPEHLIEWNVTTSYGYLRGVGGYLPLGNGLAIRFACTVNPDVNVKPEEPYGKVLVAKMKDQITEAIRQSWNQHQTNSSSSNGKTPIAL